MLPALAACAPSSALLGTLPTVAIVAAIILLLFVFALVTLAVDAVQTRRRTRRWPHGDGQDLTQYRRDLMKRYFRR